MNDIPHERLDEKREQRLDKLYGLKEDLEIIAASDARYAKYARNALETLHEEGYDVSAPPFSTEDS